MTYPTIRPALTLDFQKSKKLDPRITFTRSSTATYLDAATGLIKTAPSGVARFEKEGLLIEKGETNHLTHSAEFDNAGWTKTRTTITANAVTAPDGTTTADKLIRNTDNNINVVYQTVSLSQTTYTFSVFAKKGEYNFCTLNLPNTQGWDADRYISVDLRDGSYAVSANAPTSTSVVAYPDGWYRISITHAASSTVTRGGYIEARSSSGYGSQAGDGTSGIYIWGAQLEASSFPTSYIPTSGSTGTRAADLVSMTGTEFSSWYNNSEGTVFTEYSVASTDVDHLIYGFTGSTDSDRLIHYFRASSTQLRFDTQLNGAFESAITITDTNPSVYNTAFAYKPQDIKATINGLTPVEDTVRSGNVPTNIVQLLIGTTTVTSVYRSVNHITRLTYYPERVSDATLQELTS